MYAPEMFLDFHFLGLRIVFKPLDPALLILNVPAQIRVFFFQHSNLLTLLTECGQTLRSS